MLGAIVGDIIGSTYEFHPVNNFDFSLFNSKSTFTDDTVLTIAVAKCILEKCEYISTFKDFTRRYPNRGYGGYYHRWAFSDETSPYYSFGNGSAMRVSPVGFAFKYRKDVLLHAKNSAMVTHNHPEGIKGAQAAALAIFLARTGNTKDQIKSEIENSFGYNLDRPYEEVRSNYRFNETCQGSVPESIIAFLSSSNHEEAIRKAIFLGGDADTMACITGGIAEAYYKEIPDELVRRARQYLPDKFLEIIDRFNRKYL